NRASAGPPSQSPETEMPGRSRVDSASALAGRSIKFECTRCGAVLSAAGEMVGKKVRCPKCRETLTVAELGSLPPAFTNSIGMKFVLVKPGKFLMGSPVDEEERASDEHQHEVTITKPFYLGVHPVTQRQWKAVMGNNPSWYCASGLGKDEVKGMDTDDFPID